MQDVFVIFQKSVECGVVRPSHGKYLIKGENIHYKIDNLTGP